MHYACCCFIDSIYFGILCFMIVWLLFLDMVLNYYSVYSQNHYRYSEVVKCVCMSVCVCVCTEKETWKRHSYKTSFAHRSLPSFWCFQHNFYSHISLDCRGYGMHALSCKLCTPFAMETVHTCQPQKPNFMQGQWALGKTTPIICYQEQYIITGMYIIPFYS